MGLLDESGSGNKVQFQAAVFCPVAPCVIVSNWVVGPHGVWYEHYVGVNLPGIDEIHEKVVDRVEPGC